MGILSLVVALESEWKRYSSSQSDKKNASVRVWIQLELQSTYTNEYMSSANGYCTASQDSDKRASWTTVYMNQPKISS